MATPVYSRSRRAKTLHGLLWDHEQRLSQLLEQLEDGDQLPPREKRRILARIEGLFMGGCLRHFRQLFPFLPEAQELSLAVFEANRGLAAAIGAVSQPRVWRKRLEELVGAIEWYQSRLREVSTRNQWELPLTVWAGVLRGLSTK